MEHARKMAFVDPRLLDTLRPQPPPPPPTDTLGKKVQALDAEMKTILDRKDLDDKTKVTLYNQVLQRYNVLSDKHVKEPVSVVTVNGSMSAAVSGPGMGPVVAEGAVGVPSSGMEADVVDTVPKIMQAKASRLMEHLKRDVAWTARGELIHEGVPIEPTYGWRRRFLLLVEHRLLLVLLLVVHEDHSVGHPLVHRCSRMEHSMPTPPAERPRQAVASLAGWEDF